MALQLSSSNVKALVKRAESTMSRAKNALAKADEAIATVVNSTEVAASAFTFGLIQGKTGGVQVFGVPLELLSSGALHTLGFVGVGGKHAGHLHGLADGALAAWAHGFGHDAGLAWAQGKPVFPTVASAPALTPAK